MDGEIDGDRLRGSIMPSRRVIPAIRTAIAVVDKDFDVIVRGKADEIGRPVISQPDTQHGRRDIGRAENR